MADTYNLPRHSTESARLDAQHDAYVKIIGFLLHPRIAATLPPNARIADVGTGTGVWLHDLARESPPTWIYHGFDISDEQFPVNGGERDHTKYARLNITEPIPDGLKGQFDVVHLRLLVCGLTGYEWALAARNALQLLKPGGWIQWHESQFRDIETLQNVSGASTRHNRNLLKATMATLGKQGKMLDDALKLSSTVEAAGFVDCAEDVFSTGRVPEVREELMKVQFGAIKAIGTALAAKDARFPMTSGEMETELEEAERELEGGKAYYQWNMRIVTGRRPVG